MVNLLCPICDEPRPLELPISVKSLTCSFKEDMGSNTVAFTLK